jgi:hypothetical protein
MFALGDKYFIEGLQALSAANYSKALGRESNVYNFLRTLPDVYTWPGRSPGSKTIVIILNNI